MLATSLGLETSVILQNFSLHCLPSCSLFFAVIFWSRWGATQMVVSHSPLTQHLLLRWSHYYTFGHGAGPHCSQPRCHKALSCTDCNQQFLPASAPSVPHSQGLLGEHSALPACGHTRVGAAWFAGFVFLWFVSLPAMPEDFNIHADSLEITMFNNRKLTGN